MSQNSKRKRLLSQREKALIEDKEYHSESRLKEKILLFRKLRNKYRDIAKRQQIAARSEPSTAHGSAALGDSNTTKKAEYFDEALSHFEQRLRHLHPAEPEAKDVPSTKVFHSLGVTPEALAERAAQGRDSETAQEKEDAKKPRSA